MIVQKCFQYRIHPTREQEERFRQFAGCRRVTWNWALARRIDYYKQTGKTLSFEDQCKELTLLKQQDEYTYLQEADSQALQQVLRDLHQAFLNFFKNPKHFRFPKKKKKRSTPNAFRIPQRVSLNENGVCIPKVGVVEIKQHRPLEGTIKSATIKQEPTGKWKITFVSHIEIPDADPTSCESPIGLDVGLDTFLTTSEGDKTAPPQFYRKQEKQIKRAHRHVSRKQKGSRNRAKARKQLSRVYAKVRQKRQDFLHQLTHILVSEHDVICIENLNLSALAKSKLRGHSKSWLDAAFGQLRRMLAYKTHWNFKRLVAIDRWFASSKTCHLCRHQTELTLSDRIWTCSNPECRAVHDRDINAAINILQEGMRMLSTTIPVGTTECKTPVEESVRLLKRSSSPAKQESLNAS